MTPTIEARELMREMAAALEQITKREGAYSRDAFEHAENVIDAMAEVAEAALTKYRQFEEGEGMR